MSKIQKSKYKNYKHRKPYGRHTLDIQMQGFLCSCNNREKDCIKEAYNILNKYADILYPPSSVDADTQINEDKELDIQDELKKELEDMKSNKNTVRRFQVVESGAKNFLFISAKIEDPVRLAEKIVTDIEETKSQQTRFLIRLIPIEITCKAYINDITTAFKPLAEKYFKEKSSTFSVIYNHRNNNNLNRDEVIKSVAEIVLQVGPDNKVDLKDAVLSIIIEVIKGIALLSVVPNFIKYKKYNLLALSGQLQKDIPPDAQQEVTNSVDCDTNKCTEN